MTIDDVATIARHGRARMLGLHPDVIRSFMPASAWPLPAGASVTVRIDGHDVALQAWPSLPPSRVVVVEMRPLVVEVRVS